MIEYNDWVQWLSTMTEYNSTMIECNDWVQWLSTMTEYNDQVQWSSTDKVS